MKTLLILTLPVLALLSSCCTIADAALKTSCATQTVEPQAARVAAVTLVGIPAGLVALPAAMGCLALEQMQ